jgi:hypothetical protein
VVQKVKERYNPQRKQLFLFGSYTIGKEKIVAEVAAELHVKVATSPFKFDLLQPSEFRDILVPDFSASQFHLVHMGVVQNIDRMKAYVCQALRQELSTFDDVVGFEPMGWNKRHSVVNELPFTLHRVAYSEHCSLPELSVAVARAAAGHVVCTVNTHRSEAILESLSGPLREEDGEDNKFRFWHEEHLARYLQFPMPGQSAPPDQPDIGAEWAPLYRDASEDQGQLRSVSSKLHFARGPEGIRQRRTLKDFVSLSRGAWNRSVAFLNARDHQSDRSLAALRACVLTNATHIHPETTVEPSRYVVDRFPSTAMQLKYPYLATVLNGTVRRAHDCYWAALKQHVKRRAAGEAPKPFRMHFISAVHTMRQTFSVPVCAIAVPACSVVPLHKKPPPCRRRGKKRKGAAQSAMTSGKEKCEVVLHFKAGFVGNVSVRENADVAEGMRMAFGTRECTVTWSVAARAFYIHIPVAATPSVAAAPTRKERLRVLVTDPNVYPFQQTYSPTTGQTQAVGKAQLVQMERRFARQDGIRSHQARWAKCLQGKKPPKGFYSPEAVREREVKGQRWKRAQRRNLEMSGAPVVRKPRRKRSNAEKQARRLRNLLRRELERQRNWMRGVHYGIVAQFCRSNDVIVVPVLKVSSLVKRRTRNIAPHTVRLMLGWSHFAFRQRLASAVMRYPGRHLIFPGEDGDVAEPGTSGTCTRCGTWNKDLRVSDRVFHCAQCGLEIDRQEAAARNNALATDEMLQRWRALYRLPAPMDVE